LELKAFFQLKKTNVHENKITKKLRYPTANGLISTSNNIIKGKKIKTNQNIEKRVAGNNHVPTIFLMSIALNKINKLIDIDSNFDKIAIAIFACVFVSSKFNTYMELN
jgi:hypothetical protein